MENTKVTALPNGPLLIEGILHVTKSDGTHEVKENKTFLCRCGHSSKKPYCDGSHKANNFVG